MSSTKSVLEPADISVVALLSDLSALDELGEQDAHRRPALLRSALETLDVLLAAGGGSMGLDVAERLKGVLERDLKELEGRPC